MASLFVGIMSGTSLDGADAVLVDFSSARPVTLAFASRPFPESLRGQLLDLSAPGGDFLDLAGEAGARLADLYAEVAAAVIDEGGADRAAVAAIGCHGQTVRHRPDLGFTIQLGDPARLAERVGIDVVADFRRRDIAAGGQGAPLVPAFHEAVFRSPDLARAVVNIGGIANVTCIRTQGATSGFDCGPGNVLLDAWARRHLGTAYDRDGLWASGGTSDEGLVERLLDDPFLRSAPPKSTGRELFNEAWLAARLPADPRPRDVQASLLDFTARAIVGALDRHFPEGREIYLCGGGARNSALAGRIAELAAPRAVAPTDAIGIPSGHVEAVAFAWLAMKCARREPIDLRAVTGARHPCILGAIYPA